MVLTSDTRYVSALEHQLLTVSQIPILILLFGQSGHVRTTYRAPGFSSPRASAVTGPKPGRITFPLATRSTSNRR